LQAVPLIILISIITFGLIQLAPYDAIDAITTPDMSLEYIEVLKEVNGLNEPIYIQYFIWAKKALSGDFGYSLVTHSNIKQALSDRIPNSMLLVVPSYIIALIIAVVLGLLAGSNRGRWIDRAVDGFCSIAISAPSFWVGLILIYLLSYKLNLFPSFGMYTPGSARTTSNLLAHMVVPGLTLVIALLPQMIRYVRSSTIGQLSEDYVMVQKAFGATSHNILFRHILKNVLLPLVTLVGMSLPMLVTGAFVTESVFSWPGVGPYFLAAIRGFDYPIIMSILALSSSLVIIGNLLADILYNLIDTRIKEMNE
jgi:peptide/nickel transport system permease protein